MFNQRQSTGAKAILITFNDIERGIWGKIVTIIISEFGWFVTFLTIIVFFISPSTYHPENAFFYWLILSIGYYSLLEIISRISTNFYESSRFQLFRVIFSLFLSVTLVVISGRIESPYWLLILLPLLTSSLYFSWAYTFFSIFAVSLIYFVSLTGFSNTPYKFGQIFSNIVIFCLFTVIWKYLIEIIKKYQFIERKSKNFRTIQQLDNIWYSLASIQDPYEIVSDALKRIALSSLILLRADICDLFYFDIEHNRIFPFPIMVGQQHKHSLAQPESLLNDGGKKILEQNRLLIIPIKKNIGHSIGSQDTFAESFLSKTTLFKEGINSCIILPLRIENEFQGIIFLGSKSDVFLKNRQEIINSALSFSDYSARIIQNARFLQKGRIAQLQNEMIGEIEKTENSINDLYAYMNNFLIRIKNIIHFKKATVQLIKQDMRTLIAFQGFSEEDICPHLLRPISEDSLIQRIIKEKKPVILPDVKADSDWEECEETHDVNSWAGFPLIYGGNILGLFLLDHDVPGFFKPAIVQKLKPFCEQLAMIIFKENVLLGYHVNIEDITLVSQIEQQISSSSLLELSGIFEIIFQQVSRLVDTNNFFIALYDHKYDTVEFVLAYDNGIQQILGVGPWQLRKNGNGLTEYVVRTRIPLILSNNITNWLEEHGIDLIGPLPKSWLGIPMMLNNHAIGLICVQNYHRENAFSDWDVQALMMIATHAALAIDYSRRNHDLNQKTDDSSPSYEKVTCAAANLINTRNISDLVNKTIEIIVKHYSLKVIMYISQKSDPQKLDLRGSYPEDLQDLFFQVVFNGGPFVESPSVFDESAILSIEAISHPYRLESLIIVIRDLSQTNNGNQFSSQEKKSLNFVAGIVGKVLKQIRTDEYILYRDKSRHNEEEQWKD